MQTLLSLFTRQRTNVAKREAEEEALPPAKRPCAATTPIPADQGIDLSDDGTSGDEFWLSAKTNPTKPLTLPKLIPENHRLPLEIPSFSIDSSEEEYSDSDNEDKPMPVSSQTPPSSSPTRRSKLPTPSSEPSYATQVKAGPLVLNIIPGRALKSCLKQTTSSEISKVKMQLEENCFHISSSEVSSEEEASEEEFSDGESRSRCSVSESGGSSESLSEDDNEDEPTSQPRGVSKASVNPSNVEGKRKQTKPSQAGFSISKGKRVREKQLAQTKQARAVEDEKANISLQYCGASEQIPATAQTKNCDSTRNTENFTSKFIEHSPAKHEEAKRRKKPRPDSKIPLPRPTPFTADLCSEILPTYIGRGPTQFNLHKKILCGASPGTKAMVQDWERTHGRAPLYLPYEDSEVWEHFVQWLYTRRTENLDERCSSRVDTARNVMIAQELRVKLYCLAENWRIIELMDKTLDEVATYYRPGNLEPDPEILRYVYKKSRPDSQLREMMSRWYYHLLISNQDKENRSALETEHLKKLGSDIADLSADLFDLMEGQGGRVPDDVLHPDNSPCRWHEHTHNKEPMCPYIDENAPLSELAEKMLEAMVRWRDREQKPVIHLSNAFLEVCAGTRRHPELRRLGGAPGLKAILELMSRGKVRWIGVRGNLQLALNSEFFDSDSKEVTPEAAKLLADEMENSPDPVISRQMFAKAQKQSYDSMKAKRAARAEQVEKARKESEAARVVRAAKAARAAEVAKVSELSTTSQAVELTGSPMVSNARGSSEAGPPNWRRPSEAGPSNWMGSSDSGPSNSPQATQTSSRSKVLSASKTSKASKTTDRKGKGKSPLTTQRKITTYGTKN